MSAESASEQNPIEILQEGQERRFVIGFNDAIEVVSPLIVANEQRFTIPLKLNHAKLAELGLGNIRNRKGGFCIRKGEEILMVSDPPNQMTPASKNEFDQALTNGVVVIEPPVQP